MSLPPPKAPSTSTNIFDDDDDEGWQEMPVIREDTYLSGLDEEDQKRYHYVPSAKSALSANATGNLIDIDDLGNEWRTKADQNENEYTRLRGQEEDDSDEVHLRTKYLFDEDKAMTPLSQMQATKNLLTEAQRIAYVGLCALTSREMAEQLKATQRKEMKAAIGNMELWAMKIMGRLYYHMELETQEQKMIESLAEHGVQPMDLVPALMTTHTVTNPEYDPEEARRQAEAKVPTHPDSDDEKPGSGAQTVVASHSSSSSISSKTPTSSKSFQTTSRVLESTSTASMPGVTTTLSAADKNVTLDMRWTVLCDLFLILIADSVYDARSRVLLENVALKLGLGWQDVVRFESRVTEALEIQEDVEKMQNEQIVEGRRKSGKRQRYMMLGLATIGGGLVIGLSAGLMAPLIGAGLGAAFTTIGITGTTGFLAGAGGAAVITTGGVLTGSSIAARGMAKRTQQVRQFDVLPLHNNKRVSCILTVPGFMTGMLDDVRLPFSVLDPVVGDVFSVLWEPEMIRETGNALKILTSEVLTQLGQTVLQATVMTGLMTALQWPIILTKLGYLIDNPWNNALDRARGAGRVLADVLIQRHLGVRPITLIGFSLGARVIFYALLELARQKAYGIVQDVFILGATLSVSTKSWFEARSVVSGRFVNAYARSDWVLNYLFRATSGGVGTVAGLRPITGIPGVENVDVTDKIAGHMSYRTFMPLILDQLGFPVSADYFDEPEEPDFQGDRVVIKEEDVQEKKGWFSRKKAKPSLQQNASRPPSAANFPRLHHSRASSSGSGSGTPRTSQDQDDDLPPRLSSADVTTSTPASPTHEASQPSADGTPEIPVHAGFDFAAIKEALQNVDEREVSVQPSAVSSQPHSRQSSLPQAKPSPSRSATTPPQIRPSPTPPKASTYVSPVLPPSQQLAATSSLANGGDKLASSFSRSMTLSGAMPQSDYMHTESISDEEDEDDEDAARTPHMNTGSLPYSNAGSSSYQPDPVSISFGPAPSLTFGDEATGSIWNAGGSGSGRSSAPPLTSSIPSFSSMGGSIPALDFSASGIRGASANTFGGGSSSMFSYQQPETPTSMSNFSVNGLRSASVTTLSLPPDAGLSFGSVDGSITSGGNGKKEDMWKIPDYVGLKKAPSGGGVSSNPWS
ncbi:DUF726-domain-containing protein [Pluteus cervinus]|uniref:DUF726-domain-containing protein n=1 Tax=Pluteus cervinus TaxID=181527 RepID=A0ACD3AWC2_9AGAR|nr:DUF726-domain-containing protein [Pluteus cervinus]